MVNGMRCVIMPLNHATWSLECGSSPTHTTQSRIGLWVRSELLQLIDHRVDIHLAQLVKEKVKKDQESDFQNPILGM